MVAAPVILSSSSVTLCFKPMSSGAKLPLSTITTELAEFFSPLWASASSLKVDSTKSLYNSEDEICVRKSPEHGEVKRP